VVSVPATLKVKKVKLQQVRGATAVKDQIASSAEMNQGGLSCRLQLLHH
jgi:hypothetical protein